MEVKLSRNMTVADAGVIRAFRKGKSYDVSSDTLRRLRRAGALDEPGAATKAEPEPEKPEEPSVDIGKMTKAELEAHAVTVGATYDDGATKAKIIEAIRAASAG